MCNLLSCSDTCSCVQPTDQLFLGLCEDIIPVPACDCDKARQVCEVRGCKRREISVMEKKKL